MTPPVETLTTVLWDSRELGFLGPGDIAPQIEHAKGFLPSIEGSQAVLDLGSGGGLPGLVLAVAAPEIHFTLLDGNQRRCAFLETAIVRLGLSDRVQVANGRAEEFARADGMRGQFDAVVCRSFAGPAVTAECAVGFLKGPGSVIVISEPPGGSDDRWPAEGLDLLGLALGPRKRAELATLQELEVVRACPDAYPRRVGIPAKRPLFAVPGD